MTTSAHAQTFVVCDSVFYDPVKTWLTETGRTSGWVFDNANPATGVSVARSVSAGTVKIFVLIDPAGFDARAARNAVLQCLGSQKRIFVVAPALIQYFASRITVEDPIFKAIDTLANYPLVVNQAPIFSMIEDVGATGWDRFKYSVFAHSFPIHCRGISTRYVHPNNNLLSFSELVELDDLGAKIGPAKPIADNAALIFACRGVAQAKYTADRVVAFNKPKKNGAGRGYSRLAYDHLMFAFPSRDLGEVKKNGGEDSEAEKLLKHLIRHSAYRGMKKHTLLQIATHNRKQWDHARTLLKRIDLQLPDTPTKRNTEEENKSSFNQFTHLVISNFAQLQGQLELRSLDVSYVGAPLMARNGVCFALGEIQEPGEAKRCGIIRGAINDEDYAQEMRFKDNPQYDVVNHLLPKIVAMKSGLQRNHQLAEAS
jgi:hypothetical protein